MPWHVLVVSVAGHPPRAVVVEADAREARGGAAVLRRDGAVVYRVPAEALADAADFPTRPEADAWARAFRDQRHGAATVHVAEASAAPARGRAGGGGVLESLRVRVGE